MNGLKKAIDFAFELNSPILKLPVTVNVFGYLYLHSNFFREAFYFSNGKARK